MALTAPAIAPTSYTCLLPAYTNASWPVTLYRPTGQWGTPEYLSRLGVLMLTYIGASRSRTHATTQHHSPGCAIFNSRFLSHYLFSVPFSLWARQRVNIGPTHCHKSTERTIMNCFNLFNLISKFWNARIFRIRPVSSFAHDKVFERATCRLLQGPSRLQRRS